MPISHVGKGSGNLKISQGANVQKSTDHIAVVHSCFNSFT